MCVSATQDEGLDGSAYHRFRKRLTLPFNFIGRWGCRVGCKREAVQPIINIDIMTMDGATNYNM
jgi:hypothetical protein